jgi:hypothetical protein
VGVIQLINKTNGDFNDDDVTLTKLMATQIGAAVGSALDFDAAARQHRAAGEEVQALKRQVREPAAPDSALLSMLILHTWHRPMRVGVLTPRCALRSALCVVCCALCVVRCPARQLAERSAISTEVEDDAFRTRLQLAFAGIAAAVTDLRTLSSVVESELHHAVDGSAAVLWLWDAGERTMWCYRCGCSP